MGYTKTKLSAENSKPGTALLPLLLRWPLLLLQQAAAMGKYTACASQCKILPTFGRICTVCASLLAADALFK